MSNKQDYVCKLKKVFYGLKQALRAWFSRSDKHLQQEGYKRGVTNNNLYIKIDNQNMIIVVVYVEILFLEAIYSP